ncbi:MAG TPA: hypothetical protein VN696_12080 [Pyrinomonadaceae bacterium]|nr:hypothetical protein [Pyrinomonadaceae bacterium]
MKQSHLRVRGKAFPRACHGDLRWLDAAEIPFAIKEEFKEFAARASDIKQFPLRLDVLDNVGDLSQHRAAPTFKFQLQATSNAVTFEIVKLEFSV